MFQWSGGNLEMHFDGRPELHVIRQVTALHEWRFQAESYSRGEAVGLTSGLKKYGTPRKILLVQEIV